jgi:hypothetical protein
VATAGERQVWAHMLTSLGWMLGALRVPVRSTLLRQLNGAGRFVPLAEVASTWRTPGSAAPSIQKRHLLAVVPQVEERVAPSPARGRGAVHDVTLLLPGGQISGRFEVARGVTPAGYLERAGRFVVLEQARLRFASSRLPVAARVRLVLVNVAQVVGLRSRGPREA